jgi:acyl-CoA hydrolase
LCELQEHILDRHVEYLSSIDDCVDRIVNHAGKDLKLAAPLGLGKPNVLLNAIYKRAQDDASFNLTIYTALSLERPHAKSDIEKRFLDPFVARHFGANYPDLEYVLALHRKSLPKNVRVHEFYMQSGAMLRVGEAQRDYISMNYTHVARDIVGSGINAVVQLIAVREELGTTHYSLACNPDVTLDLIDHIAKAGGKRPLLIGVVHRDLPFIGNDAEVSPETFDVILGDPSSEHTLFALPREPIDVAEFALGLHASTLVRDGGTLQIGIGTLSDALVHALCLRQRDNGAYRDALNAVDAAKNDETSLGGTESFNTGLYGASEMVMDGFMHLARCGILKRRVYDDPTIEQALADGKISPADAENVSRLKTTRGGQYLRGAFYLGSNDFYAWLRELQGADFDGLSMTRVSDINQLYGGRESLDALQRRDARFFNICMMATVLGSAVSDALENGQVVSGVGGQYNFVAMAHALSGGRSILMLRSTRTKQGRTQSNILWNYGHCTIPRHLRDIFVTEYGIADLRGKTDEECIIAMLAITDSRFQQGLIQTAQREGKLRSPFAIPPGWAQNTPQRLAEQLAPLRQRGLFPAFPFGSDFTREELNLLPALKLLQQVSASKIQLAGFLLQSFSSGTAGPVEAAALDRLGLSEPRSFTDRMTRRAVLLALKKTVSERMTM